MLLVHPGGPFWMNKDEGAWSIPKGEVEAGEELWEAAVRELGEELGPAVPSLDSGDLVELGSVRQRAGKTVLCWAAEADFDPAAVDSNTFTMEWPPRSGVEREFPEVDRAEWFTPEEARAKINSAQAAFVDKLIRL